MIKYLLHSEINRSLWDETVDKAFNGIIYAYSWYLDIVSPGWDALVTEDYSSIMPLTRNRKFTISYLFQPAFTQQLGVFSRTRLDANITGEFLRKIPSKFKFIEINLNTFNSFHELAPFHRSNLDFELDLIRDYDRIKKGYSENLSRNLKKAGGNGLEITRNVKPSDIISLFRNNRGRDIPFLRDPHYKMLEELIYCCISRSKGLSLGVMKDGELCAGAIFIFSHNKAIFLFSGLSESGKQLQAMPFLIDYFIRENCLKNITLDFEGSNDPGLARFYKSFGSKECIYYSYRKNNLPYPLRLFK